jgi:hypothetical protein
VDLGCCIGDCYDRRVRSLTDMLSDVIWGYYSSLAQVETGSYMLDCYYHFNYNVYARWLLWHCDLRTFSTMHQVLTVTEYPILHHI